MNSGVYVSDLQNPTRSASNYGGQLIQKQKYTIGKDHAMSGLINEVGLLTKEVSMCIPKKTTESVCAAGWAGTGLDYNGTCNVWCGCIGNRCSYNTGNATLPSDQASPSNPLTPSPPEVCQLADGAQCVVGGNVTSIVGSPSSPPSACASRSPSGTYKINPNCSVNTVLAPSSFWPQNGLVRYESIPNLRSDTIYTAKWGPNSNSQAAPEWSPCLTWSPAAAAHPGTHIKKNVNYSVVPWNEEGAGGRGTTGGCGAVAPVDGTKLFRPWGWGFGHQYICKPPFPGYWPSPGSTIAGTGFAPYWGPVASSNIIKFENNYETALVR